MKFKYPMVNPNDPSETLMDPVSILDEACKLLLYMVEQHCSEYHSGAIRINACAMRFLAAIGMLEIEDDDGGRMVQSRPMPK